MTTLRLRFATRNSPESMKRGLLRDRLKRARRAARFDRLKRIDVAALQEAGTYAEQAETPRHKALWARFNDIVRGRQVGNGVVVNRWRFKSRLLEDIKVGSGDDAVHIAVVLVTHRRTGWSFKFRAVHKPTRRADNKDLRPVIDDRLREEHKRDDAAKPPMPWVTAGDFNGPFSQGVQLGDHGVDSIVASEHFEPLGQRVYDRPLLSDHAFLTADAAVETD